MLKKLQKCRNGKCILDKYLEKPSKCLIFPCENGGTCVDDEKEWKGFKCICPKDWLDENCTQRKSLNH